MSDAITSNTTALEALTEALLANTAALNEVIGLTKEGGAAAPKTTTKRATKATETKTDDKGSETTETKSEDDAVDADALKSFITGTLAPWLGKFGKPDAGHPETAARQEALKKALGQIGVEKASGITKAADLERLQKWFEKAKVVDKGFGEGRFAADPKTEEKSDDGDLDI